MARVVDDVEITSIPLRVEKDGVLGVSISREERRYAAGAKIAFNPPDARSGVHYAERVGAGNFSGTY